MASRGKKRGKVVEETVIEEKGNVPSRRTGRAKKAVNYNEDSPAVNKRKEKAKDDAKLEKEAIKNTKKGKTTKETEKYEEPEFKNPRNVKSKLPTKSKGKLKETKVKDAVSENNIDDEAHEEIQQVAQKSEDKSVNKRNKKGKKDKVEEKVTYEKEESEIVKQNEHENESELNTNGVTEVVNNSRFRGHSNRKQAKGNTRKPLADRNDNSQDTQSRKVAPDIKVVTKSKRQHNTKQDTQSKTQSEVTSTNNDNTNDTDEIITKEDITVSDKEQSSKKNKEKASNNTFTLDNVPETPVTTNTTDTPTSGRNTKQNTPSFANRMSEVIGSIRKESLGGNTPKSGHCDCGSMMSQINEILELVTDQLTDLKSEMEEVKTTNASLQTDLETTQKETRQLKEEMNNLKNTTLHQIQTNTAKTDSTPGKSPTNQNEIDMLWNQCDIQKKTIRSLHNEVDNTKIEFNQRFEKYKKAMVFILSKTTPDITHSDVSKLRNLLNKTEKCLDLTLDEICSSMESEMPRSTPNRQIRNGPTISGTCHSNSKKETSKNRHVLMQEEDAQNGNVTANHQSTPASKQQNLDPFQSRPKIRRTPVCESKK